MLRDGATVASGLMEGTTLATIIAAMVGRDLTEMFPHVPHTQGEPVLELSKLTRKTVLKCADLVVHRGEILGIAGLVGAGRTELLRAIFGLDPVRSGTIVVKGISGIHSSPRRRIAQGLGFLSEDRKGEGLALARSIEDNLSYSALGDYSRWGWLNLRRRRAEVARWMERLRVKAAGPTQAIGAALRREPAEGGAGAALASAGRHPPARRADAGDRRRLQGRDLPPDRRARRRG